jgi:hypothetical protein
VMLSPVLDMLSMICFLRIAADAEVQKAGLRIRLIPLLAFRLMLGCYWYHGFRGVQGHFDRAGSCHFSSLSSQLFEEVVLKRLLPLQQSVH